MQGDFKVTIVEAQLGIQQTRSPETYVEISYGG